MTIAGQTVVVTGGAGFIGSELVRHLALARARVIVLDNLVNGKRENLEGIDGDVELRVVDIRDEARVRGALRGAAFLFHLACLGVRHSIHAPLENHAVNATATLQLLDVARSAGISRLVHVSSSEVYGTALRSPMTEEHPTFPSTVYGAAKLAGECYARAFHRTYGFPTVVVRPFNAFGPRCHHEGDCGEVIPKFLLRALCARPLVVFGDGTQTRDFSFVSDTARGILGAALAPEAVGKTINLGSGRETSILELANAVGRVVGSQGIALIHEPPRPGDVGRLCADATKARQLLDFEPAVSLGDGLEQLLKWYRGGPRSAEELLDQEVVHNWTPEGTGRV